MDEISKEEKEQFWLNIIEKLEDCTTTDISCVNCPKREYCVKGLRALMVILIKDIMKMKDVEDAAKILQESADGINDFVNKEQEDEILPKKDHPDGMYA